MDKTIEERLSRLEKLVASIIILVLPEFIDRIGEILF